MKLSDAIWGGIGALALALGVLEFTQGRTLMSLSGFAIGALLLATALASLRKRG